MTFANPAYLWAFAGLAIPLAIHLLSRKEGRVIRVGSLRHVEESNTSQFKSIRLNEIVLWLLRSLMIVCLVMFLSGASCTSPAGSNRSKWIVVENGISEEPAYRQRIDSLVAGGYELHYLSPGFPTVTAAGNVNYRLLTEDLSKLPHDVVVISWSKAKSFDGFRTPLPPNVTWISADVLNKNYPAAAWSAGDSVVMRTASVDANGTRYNTGFDNKITDSTEVSTPEKIRVAIASDLKYRSESRVLLAALNVIKTEYRLPIEILTADTQGAQWIFWLRDARPKFDGKQQVVFIRDDSDKLIERISSNVWHIKSLNQEVAVNENLTSELLHILYPFKDFYTAAESKNETSLPEPMAWSSLTHNGDADGNEMIHADLGKYFIALLLLSLAAERFLSIRRNQ